MISPELLRRYAFFRHLDDNLLKSIAMLADEVSYSRGETLFDADQPATALYLLAEGSVDLHYIVTDRDNPQTRKDFYVGPVNPGEPFGISALIEPYHYTATAVADRPCHLIRIDAAGLRALCAANAEVAAVLMRHTAEAAMARLRETRVQLAATRL
jgi:CRP-like cAMP-binding protein